MKLKNLLIGKSNGLSIDDIAKKHKVSVDFLEKQLKMGISVEREHTPNKMLARKIALDHLTEIPDYYTKLKKMESGE